MTYSIVARDANTGEMGVAVQSHWFGTGAVVTWAEPGVGAVATQAFAERSYGPLGLERMRSGESAPDALAALVAADEGSERRQVAMVDASGANAAHTGEMCIAEASHVVGDGFSTQANMMLRNTVPDAMASAFTSSSGDLVDRLLAALDAAEAEGGDIRGKQSAALLVVEGAKAASAGGGVVVELRVEDSKDPLGELRRLVGVDRAYRSMNEGDAHLAKGEMDEASRCYEAAQAAVPGNVEFTFWRGVMLANTGHIDEARGFLEEAERGTGDWLELLRRLPSCGLMTEAVLGELLRTS